MSNTNVETVTSIVDRIKLTLAVLVIIAGIVAFSVLDDQPTVVRVALFLASLIIAAVIAWMSEPGRRTISFGRDSYGELKRVIWPRKPCK
jgi:preprotein translocase subunit SecE